jgi:hypothetical protein
VGSHPLVGNCKIKSDKSTKKKQKKIIIGDTHPRGIASEIQLNLDDDDFEIQGIFFFFFFWGLVSLCPSCTSALGLLFSSKHPIQHRFSNPVPFIKRQRSLTEAVLISFVSAVSFPKTL